MASDPEMDPTLDPPLSVYFPLVFRASERRRKKII
jgi:hypothetical protein